MSKFFGKKLKIDLLLKIFVAFLLLSFSTLLFLTSEIKSQAEEATGSASEATESAEVISEASPSAQISDQVTENIQKSLATPWKEIQGTYIAPGEKLPSENIDPSGNFFSDELIVQFKDSVADEEKVQILAQKDLITKMVSYYSKAHLVRVDSNQREKIIEELSNDPRVERVGHNDVLKGITIPREEPNDPYFVDGHQYGLEKIKAPEAWSVTKGSGGKYIAVIDTGVNYNHEDLQGKVILGRNFTTDGGQCDPMDNDINKSHGTRIAGIAAAVTNNGKGVAGVAWNPKIIAIKVGVTPSFGAIEVADGINYAVNPYPPPYGCPDVPKADVISLSIAGEDSGHYIRDAVDTALSQKVLVVAGVDNNREAGECFMGYPAAHPGVISVGGTNKDDGFSSGCHQPDSQSDDNGYTLTAPEMDIYSTVRSGGYGGDRGTSLATPFVAGALATYLSTIFAPNPSDPNYLNLIRNHLITGGVDDLGVSGYDQVYGHGRLNFCKLVSGSCPPSVSMYVSRDSTDLYQHIGSVDVGETFYITVKAESGVSGPYVTLLRMGLYDFHQKKWFMQDCGQDSCQRTWTWSFDSGASGKNGFIAGAVDTAENQGFSHSSMGSPYRVWVYGGDIANVGGQNGNSLPPDLKPPTISYGSVKVNLNWTDTTGESGFALQKSIARGTFSDFKELSTNTTSYSDTLPSSQEGKNLTYRVRAKFSDNSYSLSNEQSIDAPIVTPPSSPILRVTTSCDNRKVHYHLDWNDLPNETQYILTYWAIKTITLPANTTSYDYTDLDQTSIPANTVYWGLRADLPGGNFVYSGNVFAPATECGGGNLNLSVGTTCDEGKVHFWLSWGSIEGASIYRVSESTGGPYEVIAVISQTSLDWRSEFSSISSNQISFLVVAKDSSGNQLQISARYAPATSCPAPPPPPPPPPPPSHKPNYDANVIYLRDKNGVVNNVFTPGQTITAEIRWFIDTGYPYYYGNWDLDFFSNCGNYDQNCSGDLLTASPKVYCKAAGCNYSTQVTFTAPPTPGTYRAAAIGDRLNKIGESYENDNKAEINYTVAGSAEFIVSYRCSENGNPVADLYWPPAPRYHPQDPFSHLEYYEIEYQKPGGGWWFGVAPGPTDNPFSTENFWYGESLVSGETWGWKVKTHYWAYPGTLDWVGPIYAPIPYCPPPPPCPCDSFGDINSDGKVTQSDLDLISQYIASQTTFTDEQRRRADTTGDGQINQADIDKITAYLNNTVTTFPVCEDPDNDGLPNYQDSDDNGDGVIDPPTVSLIVSPATVTAGKPFTITVTGTSPVGLAFVWWFGQNTGITDATVTINYPPKPTSPSRACTDVVNPTKLDRAFCSPLFDAQQAVTRYSFTSTVVVNEPGTYRFGANARDVLYPTPGEAHQASEGAGIQVVEVQNQPPSLGEIGSQSVTESQPLKMTVSATDPDNDSLTYNATNLPQGASFSGQTFSWTPSYQQAGTYKVTFTASDGRLTDSKTSTITVLNDEDRDGFADTVELYIGTDPKDACPDRKENYNPAYPGDDAWPFDINNDTRVNVSDINRFRTVGVLNTREGDRKYKRRYDLNADGKVDVLDINLYSARGVLNTRCSN